MNSFTESQLQEIFDLVIQLRKEEEIYYDMIDNEYDKWKRGHNDMYDKQASQERVNNQKQYMLLLENKLYEIMGEF